MLQCRGLRHCSIYYRGVSKVSGVPRKRPPPNLKPLGAVLRQFREGLGVSQEGFAYEHDFDRSVIGAVERGERNVSFGSLRELLLAYGVSWTQFGRAMQKPDPLPSSKPPRKRR
jgi:hypothetical protein